MATKTKKQFAKMLYDFIQEARAKGWTDAQIVITVESRLYEAKIA